MLSTSALSGTSTLPVIRNSSTNVRSRDDPERQRQPRPSRASLVSTRLRGVAADAGTSNGAGVARDVLRPAVSPASESGSTVGNDGEPRPPSVDGTRTRSGPGPRPAGRRRRAASARRRGRRRRQGRTAASRSGDSAARRGDRRRPARRRTSRDLPGKSAAHGRLACTTRLDARSAAPGRRAGRSSPGGTAAPSRTAAPTTIGTATTIGRRMHRPGHAVPEPSRPRATGLAAAAGAAQRVDAVGRAAESAGSTTTAPRQRDRIDRDAGVGERTQEVEREDQQRGSEARP